MVCIGVLLGMLIVIEFCSLAVLSAIYGEVKERKKNG